MHPSRSATAKQCKTEQMQTTSETFKMLHTGKISHLGGRKFHFMKRDLGLKRELTSKITYAIHSTRTLLYGSRKLHSRIYMYTRSHYITKIMSLRYNRYIQSSLVVDHTKLKKVHDKFKADCMAHLCNTDIVTDKEIMRDTLLHYQIIRDIKKNC